MWDESEGIVKASEWVKTLPEGPSEKREQMIFEAAVDHHTPFTWHPLVLKDPERQQSAVVIVTGDSLRIGDPDDSVRVTTNHRTAQKIADALGLVLLTPKLSDELFGQSSVKIEPLIRTWNTEGTGSKTSRMVEQSRAVDQRILEATSKVGLSDPTLAAHPPGFGTLISGVGKDWVNTLRLFQGPPKSSIGESGVRSAEYGWHSKWGQFPSATLPGQKVWQPVGLSHTINHVDYSQSVRFAARAAIFCFDDADLKNSCLEVDIETLAQDPKGAWLISHEGPLPQLRHPAVEGGSPMLSDPTPPPPAPPPPDQVDRTPPPPPVVAGMGGGEKALVFGAAALAGYMAVEWVRKQAR